MSLWLFMLAPAIGLMLALFGSGGGMVAVPLLVYGLGMPLKHAVFVSVLVVGSVSALALFRPHAWKGLHARLLAYLGVGGISGSWLGVHLGMRISDALQAVLFASLLWFVAWRMGRFPPDGAGRNRYYGHRWQVAVSVGMLLGLMTGLLGVGGGFLIVPALLWLGMSDFRQAVHHSLLLVMLNAVVAGSLYMGQLELPWQPVLWIVGLAAAGCLAGQTLAGRLGAERLQAIFRVALVVVGGMMLYDAMEPGAMTP